MLKERVDGGTHFIGVTRTTLFAVCDIQRIEGHGRLLGGSLVAQRNGFGVLGDSLHRAQRGRWFVGHGRKALGKSLRPVERRSGKNQQELFAAEATEMIAGAHRALCAECEGLQHLIACVVSVDIVDLLEVVEIEDAYAKRVLTPVAAVFFLVQRLHQIAAVVNAGQFIATIENRQVLKIACPEEIAFRKAYIDAAQLEELARPLKKNGYGQYLLGLLTDKVY